MHRPVKGPLHEGGRLSEKEGCLKKRRLPEKEGDCLGRCVDNSIWPITLWFSSSVSSVSIFSQALLSGSQSKKKFNCPLFSP